MSDQQGPEERNVQSRDEHESEYERRMKREEQVFVAVLGLPIRAQNRRPVVWTADQQGEQRGEPARPQGLAFSHVEDTEQGDAEHVAQPVAQEHVGFRAEQPGGIAE